MEKLTVSNSAVSALCILIIPNHNSEAVGFQEANDKYDPEDGEGEDVLSSEFISSLSLELKRETTQIFPGSVFGLENYFSKHGTIQLDSIIVRYLSI